jgi:hypothetical protein
VFVLLFAGVWFVAGADVRMSRAASRWCFIPFIVLFHSDVAVLDVRVLCSQGPRFLLEVSGLFCC